MVIAILVILGGIVVVALGRGGELSQEPLDYAPLDMGAVSATDVMLLRPPTALWGYNMQVTDDALELIASAVRDRDVRIVALEQRIADLTGGEHYAPLPPSVRRPRPVASPWTPRAREDTGPLDALQRATSPQQTSQQDPRQQDAAQQDAGQQATSQQRTSQQNPGQQDAAQDDTAQQDIVQQGTAEDGTTRADLPGTADAADETDD